MRCGKQAGNLPCPNDAAPDHTTWKPSRTNALSSTWLKYEQAFLLSYNKLSCYTRMPQGDMPQTHLKQVLLLFMTWSACQNLLKHRCGYRQGSAHLQMQASWCEDPPAPCL